MSHHQDTAGDLSPVKRALLELRDTRAKLEALERQRTDPIAIIGLACRFPGGVRDALSYWSLLRDGVDAIREIPRDRWDADAYYDPSLDAPGKMATRWGGFVDDIDQFDADFFGISPREAVTMDPQQRMLLEVAWEALEHAGQAADRLNGSPTGVFVGVSTNDYTQLQVKNGELSGIDAYFGTGGATNSIVTGRLSYILDLRGPSVAVDTACSSSLVAIHLACQSLRSGECRMAFAGGVNTILLPELTIALSKARMLATDGRCKAFDAAGDGYVRAEGCGIVVLKRFSDALADGDRVLALVRGSAVNQDGRSSGLTAPNGPSQEAVMQAALAMAHTDPTLVDYVETHGTGTALGDPIEARALGAVYGRGRTEGRPLYIGSVKTQIGHLESASGVAGLIKVVLGMQHGEIPASLHFRTLNAHIAAERPPLEVVSRRRPWLSDGARRMAGVSSFGFGGTNAHIVVEEAPGFTGSDREPPRPAEVLALSAKTPEALRDLADRVAASLGEKADRFPDICYSANTGRAHFDHRLALVAASSSEARGRLAACAEGHKPDDVFSGFCPVSSRPSVVFLFTGQGSQYPGMGRTLYRTEPVFRRTLDTCAALVRPYLDQPLLEVMFGETAATDLLSQTAYAQPVLFSLEYALTELWRSWGVEPAAVMGHSLGESVAACVAGVFSLADGLRLMAERGRLMQALPDDGGMIAVFADEATVSAAVADHTTSVSVAAVNAPTHVVVSGHRPTLAKVVTELQAAGLRVRKLSASRAFCSPLMDPMLDAFERVAEQVKYSEPRVPFVSTVSGAFAARGEVTTAVYWRRRVRETIRFWAGLDTLAQQGSRVFLEVGPSRTLVALGRQCVPDDSVWVTSLREKRDETGEMLNALAILYANGVDVSWPGVYRDRRRPRVTLPTYPFQRQRYWHEAVTPHGEPTAPALRWSRVVQAGERQAHQGPLDLGLHTYSARWAALDRLTVEHMVAVVRSCGAFARAGDALSAEELLARCGMVPTYHHLMARWLSRLAADGLLTSRADGRFVSSKPLRTARLNKAWAQARRLNPDLQELLEYLARCGRLLKDVLTGSESPLETIFPAGEFETAEFLYQRWALARYFNAIARSVAEAVVGTLPPSRPLRAIELGAGTGGTTSALLPIMPPKRTTYVYTDMSDVFLAHAARKFADYPFVRYGLLDIEKAPAAQGYPERAFDLVVAANAIHATSDLRASLANARSLLAPGGVLLLYEVTHHLPWFEMSVGLIEGWERFADDLRQGNPLLDSGAWRRVLTESGFAAVATLPEEGAPAEVLGHHIIMALAPTDDATAEAPTLPIEQRVLLSTSALASDPAVGLSEGESITELVGRLVAASVDERHDLLVDFVRDHVTQVLRRDNGRVIDRRHRLMDLGFDSLMAVELRNRLGRGLPLTRALPATLMFDYPTIDAIASFLERETMAPAPSAVVAHSVEKAGMSELAIADLSDAEVEEMLLRKLGSV